jgi:membrane-associated protein
MDWIKDALDFVLHIKDHLDELVRNYGIWVYAVLFLIIFCETGLVVTPFLPGDSLLFAAGAVAAGGGLNLFVLCGILIVAAILGDTVNYWIGRKLGGWTVRRFPRLVKPQYLERTHAFFERYGGKAVVFARFVPIVRTFAPFVAGAGAMTYGRFMLFNVVGALLWVLLLAPAGYLFANVPFVKKNFELVIMGIIVVSVLPGLIELFRERARLKREANRRD